MKQTEAYGINREIWVAPREDGIAGIGTPSNPFNVKGREIFAAFMTSISEYTTVHMYPGVYESRPIGLGGNMNGGWRVKKGVKLLGAGVDKTIIRASVLPTDNCFLDNQQYTVIGNWWGDDGTDIVVRDMTIDANFGQVPKDKMMVIGTFYFMGMHYNPGYGPGNETLQRNWLTPTNIIVENVKNIRWGGRTRNGIECFPGFMYLVRNSIIKDCVFKDCVEMDSNGASTVCAFAGYEQSKGNKIIGCKVYGGISALGGENNWVSGNFHACIVHGGYGEVIGNYVQDFRTALGYEDTSHSPGWIIRDNHAKNIYNGPYAAIYADSSVSTCDIIVENNLIETCHWDKTTLPYNEGNMPAGLIIAHHSGSHWGGLTMIIRNNEFTWSRPSPAVGGGGYGYGIVMGAVRNLVAEGNTFNYPGCWNQSSINRWYNYGKLDFGVYWFNNRFLPDGSRSNLLNMTTLLDIPER